MKVELLHNSPLWLASHAIRMSRDNHDKGDSIIEYDVIGQKDKELIERIGNKHKHKSVLEQLVYWFDIDGISRACLQELVRHRHQSLTVKSSRYTLKELKDEEPYIRAIGTVGYEYDIERSKEYLVLPKDVNRYDKVWQKQVKALEELRDELVFGKDSNDVLKYLLPESFKTRLQTQFNGRSLQNFLELRTNKDALWEIRDLAYAIYDNLPEEHKYLYTDYLYKEKE